MFLFNNLIENAVVTELSKGSMASPRLVKKVSIEQKVSFQGVYKAITFLEQRNVVTKTMMTLSLNILWLEQINSFAHSVSKNYILNEFKDFLLLDEKEKVTYTFRDAEKLNNQWLHFVLIIAKKYDADPIFIWNPHHWFVFAREQEESILFDWLNSNQKKTYLLIGNNFDLDVEAKKLLLSEQVRVNLDPHANLKSDKYFVVIGDYIMTTTYSPEFIAEVATIFKDYKRDSYLKISDLQTLISQPLKGKIVMEKNKAKALKLSRQISKDFFLEKSVSAYLHN